MGRKRREVSCAECRTGVYSTSRQRRGAPMAHEKGTCFVVSEIGKDGSEERKRADDVLEFVVCRVLEPDYEVVRADKISRPGQITDQIIQHLLEDPLVIADLTGHNPNVFYELAVRHAARKPFIQLIQTGQNIPFDVANTRTILIDYPWPRALEKAKEQFDRPK